MTATAYKVGQGATFQKDFDAAAAPVETDGFCERELFALGPLLNTQSDLCGRFKQVDTNVGFLLQVEFVEPSNAATNWVWYLGLPFRLGNGAVVVLDGVVVQDLLGKSWLLERCSGEKHSAKFEPTSVYFSREGSAPAVVSVAAMVGELTKWVQFVASDSAMTNTLTTEQANKASSVGRGVSLLQFQNVPVEGRIALHLGSLAPSDSQGSKGNTSSLVSFSYVPTTTWGNARAYQATFLTAVTTQWTVVPGLSIALSYPTTGVLLCAFTGRFFVDKSAVKTFRLDLAFGPSSTSLTSQFRLDETFLDPSGVPLDFSYFTSVSASSQANISLNYQFQGTKTGKIIGGRTTSVFMPGASLVADIFLDSNVHLTSQIFTKNMTLSTASILIIRVAGIICRNSANETFRARILKNGDALFDGDFSSLSGTATNGSCEPLTMHSVLDAVAGSHTIAVIAKTSTTAGYLLKGLHLVVVAMDFAG
ncbi:hypothetical protein ON010_g16813 [Phytophthora cinnamomi]|nr:hypothetical protein ON010_g16813 [Phytophthora cinnamomi]